MVEIGHRLGPDSCVLIVWSGRSTSLIVLRTLVLADKDICEAGRMCMSNTYSLWLVIEFDRTVRQIYTHLHQKTQMQMSLHVLVPGANRKRHKRNTMRTSTMMTPQHDASARNRTRGRIAETRPSRRYNSVNGENSLVNHVRPSTC